MAVNEGYGCGNQSPVACLAVFPESPVTLNQGATFDASGSYDPDGSGGVNGIYTFEWDWNNDGTYDRSETYPCDGVATHIFDTVGEYTVKVRVTDDQGARDTSEETFDVVKVIYVDDDKNGDGSSWAQAFKELRAALYEAEGDEEIDEIWVAEGTYEPDDSSRSNSFVLVSGVGLYGGFVGDENGRQGRGRYSRFDDTILSGDIDDVGNDDSYHVVVGAAGATLDGFTITKGYADQETG